VEYTIRPIIQCTILDLFLGTLMEGQLSMHVFIPPRQQIVLVVIMRRIGTQFNVSLALARIIQVMFLITYQEFYFHKISQYRRRCYPLSMMNLLKESALQGAQIVMHLIDQNHLQTKKRKEGQ
jgi:hypothetical protein